MDKTMIPQETTQYLHALHGQPGEEIHFRLINDRDKTRPVLTFRSTLDRLPEVWPEIDRLNREEYYGVFTVVNKMPAGSAGRDFEIDGVSAWVYEVDDLSKEEQWKLIEQMPVPPSMVVETKKVRTRVHSRCTRRQDGELQADTGETNPD